MRLPSSWESAPRAYAAPSQHLFCAKQTMIILLFTKVASTQRADDPSSKKLNAKFMVFTLAGSLAARSPQRDSDVSDTVSSPRRRFDGVVTIFRRKVGEMWVWVLACDAGQAAEHAMGRGPRAYAAPSKCMVSSSPRTSPLSLATRESA